MSPLRSEAFGRYLLLEEIARGGMAVVYRAVLRERASGFEKRVALKRMLLEVSEDPEFVTRFTDEARIVSTFNHANIAQVFDFGQVHGEYYLTMELIDGPDLGTLLEACALQQQPIPIPTSVYIVASMARGLGAAHTRRDADGRRTPVVHRDVSPHNVLVSRAGAVKVVDFGIAQAAEKALRTRPGMVMGKCRYMAPEQAMGDEVDVRADIFATGSVLFELLAGEPLFGGDRPVEVMKKVVEQPIPAVSAVNRDVPPELDEITAHCLARPKNERYPDGSALARELEALLHRMAPDYSCDDLAAFVQELVPRSRNVWTESATQPDDAVAFSKTLPSDQARKLGAQPDTIPERPPDAHRAGSAPSARLRVQTGTGSGTAPPATGPALLHDASTSMLEGGGMPVTTDTGTSALRKDRRRACLLLGLGLGVVALLVGGGIRLASSGSTPEPERSLGRGAVIRHGGVSLKLDRVEKIRQRFPGEPERPQGSMTGVRITLSVIPPSRAEEVRGTWFTVDGHRASFWSRTPGSVTLVFQTLRESATALLVLRPPGAATRAFRLQLAAPGRTVL
jgi:serine/threonine-protein kinase